MSYMLGEVDSKVNVSATIFTNNTATYHGGAVSVVRFFVEDLPWYPPLNTHARAAPPCGT